MLVHVCDCRISRNGKGYEVNKVGYMKETRVDEEGRCVRCKYYALAIDAFSEKATKMGINCGFTAFKLPTLERIGYFERASDFEKKYDMINVTSLNKVVNDKFVYHKDFTFVRGDVYSIPEPKLSKVKKEIQIRLPVSLFDAKTRKLVARYKTITDLAKDRDNFDRSCISNCIQGLQKTYRGFIIKKTLLDELPEEVKVKTYKFNEYRDSNILDFDYEDDSLDIIESYVSHSIEDYDM